MLNSDWGYELAGLIVAAVGRCAATCPAEIVGWGESSVAGCGSEAGCSCALRVSVLEGLSSTVSGRGRCTDVRRTAEVELVLDQCRPQPAGDGYVDPVAVATLLRDQAAERWLILAGLLAAWRAGELCTEGGCGPVGAGCAELWRPGPWSFAADVGTCARYRSVWSYESTVL